MPNFERSAETRVLVSLLSETAKGSIVNVAALRAATGRDARPGDSSVQSARRIVQNEFGLIFKATGRGGLACLTDAQVVDDQENDRKRSHNIHRRSVKKLTTVVPEELNDAKRKEYFTALSFAGTMASITTARKYRVISGEMQKAGVEELPVAKTLEFLKK